MKECGLFAENFDAKPASLSFTNSEVFRYVLNVKKKH